jgi:hypothetical protein
MLTSLDLTYEVGLGAQAVHVSNNVKTYGHDCSGPQNYWSGMQEEPRLLAKPLESTRVLRCQTTRFRRKKKPCICGLAGVLTDATSPGVLESKPQPNPWVVEPKNQVPAKVWKTVQLTYRNFMMDSKISAET